jgi:hypothetical protein
VSQNVPNRESTFDEFGGTWSSRLSNHRDTIQLPLRARDNWSSLFEISLKEFKGLKTNITGAAFEDRHFTLECEAGVVTLTGTLIEGVGSGHFTFRRSDIYANELAALEFPNPPIADPFSLTLHGIGYVRELRSLRYNQLTIDDIISTAIHEVTPACIKDLERIGDAKIPADDLVLMSIHGVNASWVKRL